MNQDIYMKYKKKFCPKWCPYYRFDCDEKCEDEKMNSPKNDEQAGGSGSDIYHSRSEAQ